MKKEILLIAALLPISALGQNISSKPNVIYILADDLGIGDVSAYNAQSKITTPNIDSLSGKGMLFSDCHSSSSLSTPTRYGILTGRYNWRSTLQAGVTWSYSPPLIEAERKTVASMLCDNGYNTAVIGKWHLGLGWRKNSQNQDDVNFSGLDFSPNNNGFDYSFVMPASLDIPPYAYIRNGQFTAPVTSKIEAQSGLGFYREGPIADDFDIPNALERFTSEATQYIGEQAALDKPFFLYFPLTAPHTPILPPAEFQGKSGLSPYGDFVLYVDDVVRRIVAAVREAGVENNTIIIFTSDNGCSPWADIESMQALGHDPSGGLRGHKSDIYDGGHRVPFIVKWPAVVTAGGRCEEPVCLNSFFATMASIIGAKLESNVAEDSFSILPALQGRKQPSSAVVHHSGDGYFALRQGKWKLTAAPHSGGWSSPTLSEIGAGDPAAQLYDMTAKSDESENLIAKYPGQAKQMLVLLEKIVSDGVSRSGAIGRNDCDVVIYKKISKPCLQ